MCQSLALSVDPGVSMPGSGLAKVAKIRPFSGVTMAEDDRFVSPPEVEPGSAPSSTLESTFTLLDRARKGDDHALEELFHRHLGPLQRWARGRLPNWARDLSDTDDLVQDTLLRTFKHLDCFDPRGAGALQAYLRQAIVNRVRDELRRKGRQPMLASLDGLELNAEPSPYEEVLGRETLERYERRSNGYGLRNGKRLWLAWRWVTATRNWRRCSENQRQMRLARPRGGRWSAWRK